MQQPEAYAVILDHVHLDGSVEFGISMYLYGIWDLVMSWYERLVGGAQ